MVNNMGEIDMESIISQKAGMIKRCAHLDMNEWHLSIEHYDLHGNLLYVEENIDWPWPWSDVVTEDFLALNGWITS